MQISPSKGFIAFIAILAGLCLLTTAFVGQVGSRRNAPPLLRKPAGSVGPNSANLGLGEIKRVPEGTPVGEGELARTPSKRPISPTLVNQGGVQSMKLTAAPGGAQVLAELSLIESSPAVSYLWSLKVYDGSKPRKLLSEHYYKDKMFKVALREEAHATFSEQIALQPGKYEVEVCLYRLPDTFDLSKLADESNRRPRLVLCPTQAITVAP
jgi:hypothetical protein